MTTPAVQVERRGGQRFPFLLPVSLREVSSGTEGLGFTQDISSRGVFFFTETPLREGSEIELTLNMPAEITLGANMRVRCKARVLRVASPSSKGTAAFAPASSTAGMAETKIGVAVRLEGYEYLPDAVEGFAVPRIAALHSQHDEERPVAQHPHTEL